MHSNFFLGNQNNKFTTGEFWYSMICYCAFGHIPFLQAETIIPELSQLVNNFKLLIHENRLQQRIQIVFGFFKLYSQLNLNRAIICI